MNLFLDACAIIYLIEAREPFYSSFQDVLREIAHSNPDITVAISRLSILECLVQPLRQQEEKIIGQYRTFFAKQELQIVELMPEVVEKALWLRVQYNIRTPDALQAACSLSLTGETIFLTGDKTLEKIPDLNIRLI